MSTPDPVRVAVYGTGNFANTTHLPNLASIDGVKIVALCDTNKAAVMETGQKFSVDRVYTDAYEMLDKEEMDVLYSIVPAYARTDVETTAAGRGVHLFSEKPQALTMETARRIDEAIREAGVISTVGFRERYRPIFQEARRLLSDKRVVHVRFQQISGYPEALQGRTTWWSEMDKGGVRFFDWGVHATDYSRFMTGQDVIQAQAFFCQPEQYHNPLSSSFHYSLSEGATATLTFIESDPIGLSEEPYFTIYYEGGRIKIFGYDRIEINDKIVYQAEPFDPWLQQDKTFIESVRTGNRDLLLSDYHDGLYSLAPILAGWESTRRNGDCIDIASMMN